MYNKNYFVLQNLQHFPDKPSLFPKELNTDAYTRIYKWVNWKLSLLYTSQKGKIFIIFQM